MVAKTRGEILQMEIRELRMVHKMFTRELEAMEKLVKKTREKIVEVRGIIVKSSSL